MTNQPSKANASSCFVAQIPLEMVDPLRAHLIEKGFELQTPPYTLFQAKTKGLIVTVYSSLKIMVQGKEMKEFIEFYLEPEILKAPLFTHKDTLLLLNHDLEPKIGSDETGKGDYFGPLVVTSVFANGKEDIQWLIELGVKDSKKLTDKVALQLAKKIAARLPHETVIIRPEKYNQLYSKLSNLNELLAWAHATAISQLLKRVPTKKVLVDKFAHEYVVQRMLVKKGVSLHNIQVEQRVRAEEDVVVAAASIIARATFVEEMKNLSEKLGIELPKGASKQVIKAGEAIVKKYSSDVLSCVAKLHFSITNTVLKGDQADILAEIKKEQEDS